MRAHLRHWLLPMVFVAGACATPAAHHTDASTCLPACRPGFVCAVGVCVSACNPSCPNGQVCNANAECTYADAATFDAVGFDAATFDAVGFDATREDSTSADVVDPATGHLGHWRAGASNDSFFYYNHSPIWTGTELIIVLLAAGELGSPPVIGYNPVTDHWRAIGVSGAPSERREAAVAWSGSEILVWGGRPPGGLVLREGFRLDPVTEIWRPMSTLTAPPATANATAVWEGDRLLVWGGVEDSALPRNDGREYHPDSDTWTLVPTDFSNLLSPRTGAIGVWTGRETILWGGCQSGFLTQGCNADGATYEPISQTWHLMSTVGAPSARGAFANAWSGHEWFVWGGGISRDAYVTTPLPDGARYDPVADRWSAIPAVDHPSAVGASGVWTGSAFLIWGGATPSGGGLQDWITTDTGALFDPATGAWSGLATLDAPTPRHGHAAIWTGSEMVVAGGMGARVAFSPSAGVWTP